MRRGDLITTPRLILAYRPVGVKGEMIMPRLSNGDMRRRASREIRRSALFNASDVEEGLAVARERSRRDMRRIANHAREIIQVKTYHRTDGES